MYTIKNAENFKTGYLKALDYISNGKSENDCVIMEEDHDILQGIHAAYYENLKDKFTDSLNKVLESNITDSAVNRLAKLIKVKGMNLKKIKDSQWDNAHQWAFDLIENGYVDIPVLNKEESIKVYDEVSNALESSYREVGLEAPGIDFNFDESGDEFIMHIFTI